MFNVNVFRGAKNESVFIKEKAAAAKDENVFIIIKPQQPMQAFSCKRLIAQGKKNENVFITIKRQQDENVFTTLSLDKLRLLWYNSSIRR